MRLLARYAVAALVAWCGAAPALADGNWSPFRPFTLATRPPVVSEPQWSENPVDAFVFARLQEAGLQPAPSVDRRVWLRRVTYDVTGLPPTPDEVRSLLADPRPDATAFATVVDRLLASPRYGERWARHWLDVVRYADTDGFAIDEERPTLWRYRDYVIRALNEDRPFDRFVREQLAGDLGDRGPEGIVATSFYRLGPYEADNMVPENRRQDFLNEMTTAVGEAFLGLTVGCARCHNHKYDPIPQADFYRLQAFLAPLDRADVPAEFLPAEVNGRLLEAKGRLDAELARRRAELSAVVDQLKQKLAAAAGKTVDEISDRDVRRAVNRDDDVFSEEDRRRYKELKKQLDDFKLAKRFEAVASTVSNDSHGDAARVTHVLLGGDPFNPGEEVQPGFLSAVKAWQPQEEGAGGSEPHPLTRRDLADWVASPQNPLTARVLVNRVWQYCMGQGIVATANDFGANGAGPSHPELLDYLSHWFVDHDWSIKRLVRLLVLSRTYRTSGVAPDAESCASVDPDNRLLWRAHERRLDAETIRDAVLAVSGRLNFEMGGPGFYEALPDGMEAKYSFFEWHPSADDQRCRRSIYMFQRRNLVHPLMEVFDGADLNQSCERRKTSVTAPQVLAMFNSRFAHEAAGHFARRVQSEAGEQPRQQIEQLFWIALARAPESDELDACSAFLTEKADSYAAVKDSENTVGDPALAALTDLCLVLLNANEFIYLD